MRNNLRSAVTMTGRRMAGARSLWRANGMKDEQFGMPVIGIVNSFTDVNPGHRAFKELVGYVKEGVWAAGGSYPPARNRTIRKDLNRRTRMLRSRIQYHSHRRRNRHGPRRDVILASFAGNHRRQCGIHGQRPSGRRFVLYQ